MADRLKIKETTIKALFAKSNNQCAFPGCSHELISSKNIFIGQVCHIESPLVNGPRYNPAKTSEDLRSFDNLVILCYPHHKEIDADHYEYTVERLKQFKKNMGANKQKTSLLMLIF